MANGVLPYQLAIPIKDVFDCQMISEDERYRYDDSLEVSVLVGDQVRIYDFMMEDKKWEILKKFAGIFREFLWNFLSFSFYMIFSRFDRVC